MATKKKKSEQITSIEIIPEGKGRPKEDLSSLPIGWKEHIIGMYAIGACDAEIMATLYHWRGSFSKSLWYRWINEIEEFKEVIEVGHIISEAWWSKFGRENLKNSQFNNILYIWRTKNQFRWNDKGEQLVAPKEESEIDYSKLPFDTLKQLINAKRDAAENKS